MTDSGTSGILNTLLQGRWKQTRSRTIGLSTLKEVRTEVTLEPMTKPQTEKVLITKKLLGGKSTQCTHPLCLLSTTVFESRYTPGPLPLPVPPTFFDPIGDQDRTISFLASFTSTEYLYPG